MPPVGRRMLPRLALPAACAGHATALWPIQRPAGAPARQPGRQAGAATRRVPHKVQGCCRDVQPAGHEPLGGDPLAAAAEEGGRCPHLRGGLHILAGQRLLRPFMLRPLLLRPWLLRGLRLLPHHCLWRPRRRLLRPRLLRGLRLLPHCRLLRSLLLLLRCMLLRCLLLFRLLLLLHCLLLRRLLLFHKLLLLRLLLRESWQRLGRLRSLHRCCAPCSARLRIQLLLPACR